jgi:hypothetical protein
MQFNELKENLNIDIVIEPKERQMNSKFLMLYSICKWIAPYVEWYP